MGEERRKTNEQNCVALGLSKHKESVSAGRISTRKRQIRCHAYVFDISLLRGDFLSKHKNTLVLVGHQLEQYKCDVMLTELLGDNSLPLSDTSRFVRRKTFFL